MKYFDIHSIESYKALLFDLDGTLVDSMPAHNEAWQEALKIHGVNISEDELYKLAGTPNLKTAEIFIEQFKINANPLDVVTRKESHFENSLATLKPISIIKEIVLRFHNKLPLGIVSGSPRHRIKESLSAIQLENYFDCVVSCDDTQRGKPFPDPYEWGAKQLGMNPVHCLVFEDGEAGIQSALSAKMNVVWVKNGNLYSIGSEFNK